MTPSLRRLGAALWLAGILACGGGTPTPAPTAPAQVVKETSLTRTLAEQAEAALAQGDIDTAESRYQRALTAEPRSVLALSGLGRIATRRGAPAKASAYFERALALAPEDIEARLGLARALRDAGDLDAARSHLERALQQSEHRPDVQFALAELTGRAPQQRPTDLGEAARLANAHPFDPRALTRAGRFAEGAGRPEIAKNFYQRAFWLASFDEEAGLHAFARLQAIDPEWKQRRLVPVHCWADQTVRADPAWRFRLIRLFRNLSLDAAPMIETAFVPLSMNGFETADSFPSLRAMDDQLRKQAGAQPARGIMAAFTERPPPAAGTWRLGQAEFLGSRMFVRLEPGELRSHVLAHEMLHLYGGIHISPEIDSIMNPSGGSYALDPLNEAIFRSLRNRRFQPAAIGRTSGRVSRMSYTE